jgi:chaperonin GroES
MNGTKQELGRDAIIETIATSPTQGIQYDFDIQESAQSINEQPQYDSAFAQLLAYIDKDNIADELDSSMLSRIAAQCVLGYDIDKKTRDQWLKNYAGAIDLAKMVWQRKNTPWEGASNVKHPMIAQAAIQFNSRAMPNIIPESGGIVKGRVIGRDQNGQKASKASRISQHMSYQLGEQMIDWIEDTDKLLITLPIVGAAFKKTYYDAENGVPVSELVYAQNLVVNNDVPSLRRAPRISEVIWLYPNEVRERVLSGIWLDVNMSPEMIGKEEMERREESDASDEDAQKMFVEQHCWFDLDNDGYKEPYIVTFHYDTQQVVRIVARYEQQGILATPDGTVLRIKPIEYYTLYTFLPDPDGKLLGMGYGILFKSTTETVNTAINQLLDAATDQNAGGGFIDEKLKRGSGAGNKTFMEFSPGKYYWVKTQGTLNIRDSIFPRPTSQPSTVLFQLLEYLVEHSERTMSSTDVLQGQQSMANVPATTTMALIEQGLKVFGAVYKRIHKSLADEFRKVKRLNAIYLPDEEYYRVLDDEEATIARADYEDSSLDVVPVSDPNNINDAQVLLKAEAMLGLVGQGYNDEAIRKRYLEALRIPNVEELLEGGEPQPDPKVELESRKLELDERRFELEVMTAEVEARKTLAQAEQATASALKAIADAEAAEAGQQLDQYQAQLEGATQTVQRMKSIIERQMKLLSNTEGQQGQGQPTMEQPTMEQPTMEQPQNEQPIVSEQ